MQSVSVFIDITKVADFWQKMLMSAELNGCACDLYIFWIFFRQGVSLPSFIIVGYV